MKYDTFFLHDKDYRWEDVREYSYEELTDLLEEAREFEEALNLKLKHARGEYAAKKVSADWDWYRKTELKKHAIGRIRRQLSQIRRTKKPSHVINQEFVAICRESLDEDTFKSYMDDAEARYMAKQEVGVSDGGD